MKPWNTSAETYALESEKILFYSITNRELIAAGQIQPGMSIVDLGCGAGLTTRAIFAAISVLSPYRWAQFVLAHVML